MSKNCIPRILSLLLAAAMVFSLVPATYAAETSDTFVSETHDVFSRTTTTIAPGVTQDICYAYAKDGKQMVYYVATADVTRDDVVVQTSYLNQHENGVLGMEKLTNQIAYANQKYSNPDDSLYISDYYNVVAGVNASFYNMTTGQPMGITYVDGVSFGTSSYDNFFAILNDGKTAVIDYAKNLGNYVDAEGNSTIWQAVAGSQWLVRDGVDVTASATGSYNTDRHSRTCVGITADGKVVTMVLDGRQEPFSCGGSMHELAQIMLEAGCVAAINLDGGGSTTYAARQAGSDSVAVINRPSDGSERSISAGLIIASTAAPSNVFATAVLTAESDYVTPGSIVNVSAVGVSPAGTSAEIPESVTWQLADDSLGTVENGVFTSNGTTGDAVVQMVYEGSVVGESIIHVVIPDSIEFSNEAITVPYGKTATLEMVATYGLNEVVTNASDFVFTLADETAGTISGLSFTACEESAGVTGTTITAQFVGSNLTAEATLTFGKGSEVLFDFEDGTTSGFKTGYGSYNYYLPNSDTFVADAENGKVHNGDYSLGVNIDYSNSQESGYMMTALFRSPVEGEESDRPLIGAQRLGMWVYIPDEYVGLWARWVLYPISSVNEDGTVNIANDSITSNVMDDTAGGTGVVYSFNESGWHYLSCDFSSYAGAMWRDGYYCVQFYISDRDGASYNYYAKENPNINGSFTIYIDDITVDYSTVVEDREAPIFSGMNYATYGMSDAVALADGASIANNTVDFTAVVSENTGKANATGIDASTAKAYVDGNEVACTYSNDSIAMDSSAVLSAGQHTIKFSICDKQGNYASIIRKVNITSGEEASVKVVPHDATLDRILFGSLYYVDVVAADIANVQSVTTTLNLDSMNEWELDHMEVAEGFAAAYTYDAPDKILHLTITKTGETELTGEQALVSIPVRVWELDNVGSKIGGGGVLEEGNKYTYAWFKSQNEYWWVAVEVRIQQGAVTLTDGTSETFTGEKIHCDTEAWAIQKFMVATEEGVAYKVAWDGGHIHTAQAIDDKAATCTEAGYTGRTYCEVCSSIVDWGTTVPATGHTYDFVDGVLKCSACGELFTGEWTDGKLYVDGVTQADGWAGDSYYMNGEKLTGIRLIDGYYYNFGEDGVCASRTKYTGFIFDETGVRYSQIGILATGWKDIDGNYYYFYSDGYAETESMVYYAGQPYYFDETGKLISGFWHNDGVGTKYYYGPSYYNHEWAEVDGSTYYFDSNGHRLEGWNYIIESGTNPPQWYEFDENGVLLQKLTSTGLFEANGQLYYTVNGVSKMGLILAENGCYYYFKSSTLAAVKNCVYWVSRPNDTGIPAGNYEFDEQGRMVIETEEMKNGIVEEDGTLYYYVDGVRSYAGLIQIDGDYYYVNSSCKVVTTSHYWVNKTNGLLPAGFYDFGTDGKMIVETEEMKNGIVEEDGTLYYYVDGVRTYAGLIQIDGDYYYVNSSCKVVTTSHYWVYKTNDLLPAGFYDFGADGKMIAEPEGPSEQKNGIVEEDGTLYYYVDGVRTYAGLIQIDGDYYYVNSSCKVVTTSHYWVNRTNDLLPAGFYDFGADGKMIR